MRKIDAIVQMIPSAKREHFTCALCSTNLSVKYIVLIDDRHYACCNRCVFKHYVKGEIIDILPEKAVKL